MNSFEPRSPFRPQLTPSPPRSSLKLHWWLISLIFYELLVSSQRFWGYILKTIYFCSRQIRAYLKKLVSDFEPNVKNDVEILSQSVCGNVISLCNEKKRKNRNEEETNAAYPSKRGFQGQSYSCLLVAKGCESSRNVVRMNLEDMVNANDLRWLFDDAPTKNCIPENDVVVNAGEEIREIFSLEGENLENGETNPALITDVVEKIPLQQNDTSLLSPGFRVFVSPEELGVEGICSELDVVCLSAINSFHLSTQNLQLLLVIKTPSPFTPSHPVLTSGVRERKRSMIACKMGCKAKELSWMNAGISPKDVSNATAFIGDASSLKDNQVSLNPKSSYLHRRSSSCVGAVSNLYSINCFGLLFSRWKSWYRCEDGFNQVASFSILCFDGVVLEWNVIQVVFAGPEVIKWKVVNVIKCSDYFCLEVLKIISSLLFEVSHLVRNRCFSLVYADYSVKILSSVGVVGVWSFFCVGLSGPVSFVAADVVVWGLGECSEVILKFSALGIIGVHFAVSLKLPFRVIGYYCLGGCSLLITMVLNVLS